ncbi:hypothetical protein D3C80_1113510 [compost metagenome]
MADHLQVRRVGDVDYVQAHAPHGCITVLAALLHRFGNEQRRTRPHPGRTVAGARVGLEHCLVLRIADDLPRHSQHIEQLRVARLGHVPGLVAGVVQVVGVLCECVLVARCGRNVHHIAAEIGGNVAHPGALLLTDRRIRMLDIGGAGGDQLPVLGQRAVHLVNLEALEVLGLADGFDLVRLTILVAQDAKAAGLEGLHHDVLAKLLVPLDRRCTEEVVRRVGVDLLTRAFRPPGCALGQYDFHILGIGDVKDLQVATHVLVEVTLAVEVDDVLPGVEGLDRNRVIGLYLHVLDVALGIPVIQLAGERLAFMGERRGHGPDELAGSLVHAIAAGCRHRRNTLRPQFGQTLDDGIGDVHRGMLFGMQAGAGEEANHQRKRQAAAFMWVGRFNRELRYFHYLLRLVMPHRAIFAFHHFRNPFRTTSLCSLPAHRPPRAGR